MPAAVRVAGALVGVQGLTGLSIAAGLVVLTLRAPAGPVPVVATAAWLGGFGALLLAVGAGLLRGRHGARTPAIVAQLLLLGVSWYAAGPSHQLVYGALRDALRDGRVHAVELTTVVAEREPL